MGTQVQRPSTQRVGQILGGRYRITALIGEGRSGVVYQAEHAMMHKRVALKLLHASLADDAKAVARFRREAEAASQLDHPNLVAAKDFGRTEDGAFFLVMDYVEGRSLRAAIDAGPLSPARAVRIARHIAQALRCAHRAGIVHRDIKPENVMLVRTEEDKEAARVLDFGIAGFDPESEHASAEQPLTRAGALVGTPAYMAPEQAVGEAATPASDLYALGVVLFEMLAGRHPFDGAAGAIMSKHVVGRVPQIAERAPTVTVPPELEAIVHRLLEKAPNDRLPNADAVIDALEEVARALPRIQEPSRQHTESAREQGALARAVAGLTSSSVRWRRTLGLVALAVVMATVGAAFALRLARSPARAAAANVATSGTTRGASAPPERIHGAAALGTPALEQLADEFPGDAAVLRELAFAYDAAGRPADALRAVDRTARLTTGTTPRDLVRVVVRAASKFETADEAFRLLEGPLGQDGVEGLLELSADASASSDTRARASRSLAKPAVRKNASEATGFLLDLKSASSCEAKRQLLDQHHEQADGRALPALRALRNTYGCGRHGHDDCHRCLRGKPTLDRAIHAAEARAAR